MSQCELLDLDLCEDESLVRAVLNYVCSPTLVPGVSVAETEEEKKEQKKRDAAFWRAHRARAMYDKGVQDVEHEQLIFGFKQRAILSKRKEEDRGMKTPVGWRKMKRRRILEGKVLTEEEKSLAGKEKLVKAEVFADLASKGIEVDPESGQPFDIVFKEEMKEELSDVGSSSCPD